MRVLMLAQSYAPVVGGEERVVEDLSHELVDRGHEVSIATLTPNGSDPARRDPSLPVHVLPSGAQRLRRMHRDPERRHAPPIADPETVAGLRRVLTVERPDVVHAHNWLVHSYLPLARTGHRGLVLSLHDYSMLCAIKRLVHEGAPCTGPAPVKCVRCASGYYDAAVKGAAIALATRAGEHALRRLVDVFLPVSAAVRDTCGLGSARVVPNFVRDRRQGPVLDSRLDQLPDEPFMLFLGDITYDKGALHLTESYRSLHDPPPLVFVGRRYMPELTDVPGITMLGPWPHALVAECLRRCMFLVAPSILPEPFGLVALEAAAAGRPVVASDTGGLRGTIIHERTGLLVPPGDADALTAALRRLIGDPPLRQRFGAAASVRAEAFSAEAVVPLFEEAYELAASRRRGHGPENGR